MPRSGGGVYSVPAGTAATPNTTVESAKYNAFVADIAADQNTARPIVAGGTGANSASGARTALGVPSLSGADTITGNWTVSGSWSISGDWSFSGAFEVQSSAAATVTLGTSVDNGNDATLTLRKARGGGTPGQITAGDDLGTIQFQGYDGADYQVAASIRADSTANTGAMGGKLLFVTNGSLALTLDESQKAIFAGEINLNGADISDFLDEDDLSSNSATAIPSQQSVKAYVDGLKPVLKTAQATTSGTSFDFTSIPSWATEVSVFFDGVSLSGTDNLLVQLGDSGGIEATGYDSSSHYNGAGGATSTAGNMIRVGDAGRAVTGTMTMRKMTGNKWIAAFVGHVDGVSSFITSSGKKTLSDTLTQVRITRSGADAFDAGSVNVSYR